MRCRGALRGASGAAVRCSAGAVRGAQWQGEVSASREGAAMRVAVVRGVRWLGMRCAALCCVWCGNVVLCVVRGCSATRSVGLYAGVWNGVVWDAE